MKETEQSTNRHIRFEVGEEEYAIPLDSVKEILRLQDLTDIPHSSYLIEGVMNLRGSLLTVINGRRWLSSSASGRAPQSRVIVVKKGNRIIGILVDRIIAIEKMAAHFKEEKNMLSMVYDPLSGAVLRILQINDLFEEIEKQSVSEWAADASVHAVKEELEHDAYFADEMSKTDDLCLKFHVGNESYGIPLTNITEIVRMPKRIESLPGSAGVSFGTVIVRDELIPLIDMRKLMGVPSSRMLSRVIILKVNIGNQMVKVGLAVDQAKEILSIKDGLRVKMPIQREGTSEWITGAFKLGNESVIFMIDSAKLLREDILGFDRHFHHAGREAENELSVEYLENHDSLYLIFQVGDEEFGLPAEEVKEILRVPPILQIPQCPMDIIGITNVRGRILTLIDVHQKLGLKPIPPSPSQRLILMESRGRKLGFIADQILHSLRVPQDAIQTLNEWEYTEEYIKRDWACIKLDQERVIMLCEPETLFET